MSGLTDEQLALLNNFMYSDQDSKGVLNSGCWSTLWKDIEESRGTNKTLGELIEQHIVSTGTLDGLRGNDSTTFMASGDDWANVVNAIRSDPKLRDLRCDGMDSHAEHGAKSVCFVDSSGQPYVLFKGTGNGEWPDNFTGAGALSTEQQRAALSYTEEVYSRYGRNVVVSGHSKGGNKAQYVTIMSDHVDRCVSLDGQGFSREFVTLYADRVKKRSGKITAYNHNYDPVSALLIPVAGTVIVVAGAYAGIGNFFSVHAPITLLDFGQNGRFGFYGDADFDGSIESAGIQSALAREINRLTLFLCNTASASDLEQIMGLFADIFANGIERPNIDVILSMSNVQAVGLFISYLGEYDGYDDLVSAFLELIPGAKQMFAAIKLPSPNPITSIFFALLAIASGWTLGAVLQWLGSHSDWINAVSNVVSANRGRVSRRVRSSAQGSAVNTAQVRDFTDVKKQELLSIVRAIQNENPFDVVHWDIWYRAERFLGRLTPERYQNNMGEYYRKVMDINDAAPQKIEQIFSRVYDISGNYATKMAAISGELDTLAGEIASLKG